VRDRGQERVLHLVEGSESLGGIALAPLGLAQSLFRMLPLGDVHEHSLQEQRCSVGTGDERRLVMQPDRPSIARVDAVLRLPGPPRCQDPM